MTDLSLLSSLDLVVLDLRSRNRITIANPSVPEWVIEAFGENWNPVAKELKIDDFSSIGMFIRQTIENFQSGVGHRSERISFQDNFGGERDLVGQITSLFFNDRLRFIIRRVDELDEFGRRTIRDARSAALEDTHFQTASDAVGERLVTPLSERDGEKLDPFLEAVVSLSGDAIIILNKSGNLVSANSAALDLVPGLKDREDNREKGFDAIEKILKSATLSRQLVGSVTSSIDDGFEGRIMGFWKFAEPYSQARKVTIQTVKDENGQKQGSVWVLAKSASTNPIQESVSRIEETEVFEKFIGELTEDFNGILSNIRKNLAKMKRFEKESGSEELKDSMDQATSEAAKGSSLIRHLRGYSGNARLTKKVSTADGLITEAIALFRCGNPVCPDISFRKSSSEWKLMVDEEEFVHVLQDLFENCSHAAGPLGEIAISNREYTLNDPELSAALQCDPGHYVIVTLSDNGKGMDKETAARAFEPFFTTREGEGKAGLGLANARGIIEMHGGKIHCTSVEDEGTVFSIYLPRHRVTAPDISERSGLESPEDTELAGNENELPPAILIVDDDIRMRSILEKAMKNAGLRTLSASNGVEALDLLSRRANEISVILLDLAMPEMTGFEAFRRLSRLGSEIPVIVASGFAADADHFRKKTGGEPYAVFQKPYQLEDLLTKVQEITDFSGVALPS